MKLARTALIAAALMLPTAAANAVVLDLYTMTCKQFVESDKDTISMMLTWLDGWYKGDSDEAKIDTDVFIENAKKIGEYCGKNPTTSIVNAAETVLGK
jgi:acid stress chaperone HdeB